MKALVAFIMRGRSQALMMFMGFTLLSFVFPLFSIVSMSTLALVTLRLGAVEGVVLLASWLMLVVGFVLVDTDLKSFLPMLAPYVAALVLLWAVALILRYSRSLPLAVMVLSAVGIAFVVAVHLVVDDPAALWNEEFNALFASAANQMSIEQQQQLQESLHDAASVATGTSTVVVMLYILACLFIARWWQAILYNPGGFQMEFHRLRFDRRIAVLTVGVIVLMLVAGGDLTFVARNVLIVFTMIYALQGISVVHALVQIKHLHAAWLVGLYIMSVLMTQVVAVMGFIDTWLDFRRRAGGT